MVDGKTIVVKAFSLDMNLLKETLKAMSIAKDTDFSKYTRSALRTKNETILGRINL